MVRSTVKAYTGIATTVTEPSFPLPAAMRTFGIQVSANGTMTSWTVTLEGSLDNANWTTLVTHNANIGTTQWAVDKPVTFLRVNVSSLTLNSATAIAVYVAAMP